MQQKDCRAIGGAGFGVSDIQEAGVDLFQRARTMVFVPGLIAGRSGFVAAV